MYITNQIVRVIHLRFVLEIDLHTRYVTKGINWGVVIDQNLSYPSIKVYASGLAINSICWNPNLTILIFWSIISYLNLWRLLEKKESNLHSIDPLSSKNLVTIFTLQAKLVVDDES